MIWRTIVEGWLGASMVGALLILMAQIRCPGCQQRPGGAITMTDAILAGLVSLAAFVTWLVAMGILVP